MKGANVGGANDNKRANKPRWRPRDQHHQQQQPYQDEDRNDNDHGDDQHERKKTRLGDHDGASGGHGADVEGDGDGDDDDGGDVPPPRVLGCVAPGDVTYSFPEERALHEEADFACIIQTGKQNLEGFGDVKLVMILSQRGIETARRRLKKTADEADAKAKARRNEKMIPKTKGKPRPKRKLKVPW
uniref:Uncharacterized protein n=1 Tax=Lotharella oceanica TaxID=641309 RepID=A0A7S2U0G6_9EUKA